MIMLCGFTKEFIHHCTWSLIEVQYLLFNVLKPLNSNDNTSQLYLHKINCDFFIQEACSCCLDYVGGLDSSYCEMYIDFVLVNIH